MFNLFIIWSLLGVGSAFRFGFGRVLPAVNRKSFSKCSVNPNAFSFPSNEIKVSDFCAMFDMTRIMTLVGNQIVVNATVYPAIDNSPYLRAKYPNPLNHTVQNVLGGLPDVVDIEYLNTLPADDPRRHFLATMQDPGPERRAELNENLQAIDAERGYGAKGVSTYFVYQKLSRKSIDRNLRNTFNSAAAQETLRRKRPEFTEYGTPGWFDGLCAEELSQFVEKCFKEEKDGLLCVHPCLPFYFPYYLAEQPHSAQMNCTFAQIDILSEAWQQFYATFSGVFDEVVYPAIAESRAIAEKYPNPADRTPHKLLGGLANIISIEYMQSLEPHDPRRLFLDTLTAPDEQRCDELESNALLVNRAVMDRRKNQAEPFSLLSNLVGLVKCGVELTYLISLQSAGILEMMRRYAKNNGVEGAEPEGDAYRSKLMKLSSK